MTGIRRAHLILAFIAVLAPMAHVLELPNKMALSGPLWLAVQQHLYRGWGPFLGAPVEIGALAVSLYILLVQSRNRPTRGLAFLATLAYAAMIAAFFVFNSPVNNALNGWTAATLPPDWPAYRLQWELGHVLAALLSLLGLVAVTRISLVEVKAGVPPA